MSTFKDLGVNLWTFWITCVLKIIKSFLESNIVKMVGGGVYYTLWSWKEYIECFAWFLRDFRQNITGFVTTIMP